MGTSSTTRGLVLMQLLVLLMPVPFFGYATCFCGCAIAFFLVGLVVLIKWCPTKTSRRITKVSPATWPQHSRVNQWDIAAHVQPTAGLWWGIFCVAKYIRRYTRHGPTFFWANWTKLLPFLGGYRALTCIKGVTQIGRRAGMRLKKHGCLASASSVSIPASGH